MGWMTLHSISVCYPDEPTASDKAILLEFMNGFTATITCHVCRDHFSRMFADYKANIPSWNNSKRDLFIAICRMHNVVNKRLDKPYPKTIEESLNFLKSATAHTSPSEFRKKYIDYLAKDWYRYGRNTSYYALASNSITNMKKINESYWNIRDTPYSSISFEEDNIVSYKSTIEPSKILLKTLRIKNFVWRPQI